jgi:hypothetical protein
MFLVYLISATGIYCSIHIHFEWVLMDAYGLQLLGEENLHKFLKLVKIQSIRQCYSDIVEMQHCSMA